MQGQPWHGLAVIATLGTRALANPLAHWNVLGNASLNYEHLMMRDITEFDPTDLSFITRMAAIGDSYSAGIGAGDWLGTLTQVRDPESEAARHGNICTFGTLLKGMPMEVAIDARLVNTAAGSQMERGSWDYCLNNEETRTKVQITEDVVKVAARNEDNGKEVMALLLEQRGDQV
ncbi:Fibronectin type III domain protein [Aspergillus bombycis]|uniref:Fibronectin type III domain protein n=1 Tax=Aspergillus bombycis TaxID=109264 RepID=A0A1F7ZL16_9EURO|nr:Fibronectin type III domain protein [Aspergillus bombycis]OGM39735.1 Fibronectin type III domain protein [Aspergillus bombycis]